MGRGLEGKWGEAGGSGSGEAILEHQLLFKNVFVKRERDYSRALGPGLRSGAWAPGTPGMAEQREGEAGGRGAAKREGQSSSFHGNSHPVVGLKHLPRTHSCRSQHHFHGLAESYLELTPRTGKPGDFLNV